MPKPSHVVFSQRDFSLCRNSFADGEHGFFVQGGSRWQVLIAPTLREEERSSFLKKRRKRLFSPAPADR
jgi:hypothetical protein